MVIVVPPVLGALAFVVVEASEVVLGHCIDNAFDIRIFVGPDTGHAHAAARKGDHRESTTRSLPSAPQSRNGHPGSGTASGFGASWTRRRSKAIQPLLNLFLLEESDATCHRLAASFGF